MPPIDSEKTFLWSLTKSCMKNSSVYKNNFDKYIHLVDFKLKGFIN